MSENVVDRANWQPAEQHWQVGEAVLWIVYRIEPDKAPKTVIPDYGDGRMKSETLMAALQARAAGHPRSWPPAAGPVPTPCHPNDDDTCLIPAYRVRFGVKRWMRKESLDAVGLLTKESTDLAKYEADLHASNEQQALFTDALRALNAAARNGLIHVLARPSATWERKDSLSERAPVRATVFDEYRSMDIQGSIRVGGESGFNFLHDAGPFFHDALVVIDQVKRRWPSGDCGRPPSSVKMPKQPVRGLNFAEADAPLVALALAGLKKQEFRNATDAARALAHRAQGAGNEESKMKRLLGRITRADQSRSVTEQD